MRFIALGDVMVDVVCAELPAAGERVHAPVTLRAGGSAVNAAVCAVRLGASAAVVGRVGDDAAAELVRSSLHGEGVEAQLARDDERPTGTAVALGSAVVASRGANAAFSEEDVADPLTGDTLLVSGFALFQSGSATAAVAGLRRFTGTWAAVDLGSPRLAADADLGRAAGARIVFATAAEARAVTGADPEQAARELARTFTIACVKLGADGAVAAQGERLERAAATPVTRVAPFGAGDAFAAGFLVALGHGSDLGDALQTACEAGARAAAGH